MNMVKYGPFQYCDKSKFANCFQFLKTYDKSKTTISMKNEVILN